MMSKMKDFSSERRPFIFSDACLAFSMLHRAYNFHRPLKYDLYWNSQDSRDVVLEGALSNGVTGVLKLVSSSYGVVHF
jgi:hypothetical protein